MIANQVPGPPTYDSPIFCPSEYHPPDPNIMSDFISCPHIPEPRSQTITPCATWPFIPVSYNGSRGNSCYNMVHVKKRRTLQTHEQGKISTEIIQT